MSVLNKPIVLPLNAHWQALAPTTPEKALIDMAKETVHAINIDYFQNPDGTYDFEKPIVMEPVGWDRWITLPLRDFDWYVQTPRLKIRVPTVVVCVSYSKVPMARRRLTNKAIAERDRYICQYTGQRLTKKTLTVDHILPKSRGGKTAWENLVACHKDVNRAKDNRLNHEVGLKLMRQPKAPPLLPVSVTINEIKSRDWVHFLMK